MSKTKRIFALIFASVFALVIISSALFIVENSDHNCTGDNCSVCLMISGAVHTFTNVKKVETAFSVFAVFVIFSTYIAIKRKDIYKRFSLTDQQIKLTV